MNKEDIQRTLIERGYSVAGAKIASADLAEISDTLKPLLENWLYNSKESDYESNGMSVKSLMAKFHMKYPAALLSMDWVIRDPQTAITVIKKGLK